MSISLSSTNRVQHSIIRESTYGVTPTSPAFQNLRVTGSSLSANPTTVVSDELRSDRQVADLILVGTQSRGDLSAELSFSALDPMFEEAVQGAWASNPNIINTALSTPISALSTTTATVASGGAAFLAGMICQMSGFLNAANNLNAVVSSSSGTTIVFPASTFTADVSPQKGATIRVIGFQGASADIATNSVGLTSTVLDFTTLGLVIGEWIKVGGTAAGTFFATAANNDWVRISKITAHALFLDVKPAGWGVDAGTGKTISIWMGDYLRNGSTMYSNTVERQYLDQTTPTYEYLTGMVLAQLSLTVAAQQIVKTTLTYDGRTGTVGTSRASGATDISAPTFGVLNGSANVGRVAVGGTTDAGPNYVMETTITLNNNLRPLYALSNIGAIGMGDGEMTITGSLNTYFGDTTFYAYMLANTAVSFDFRVSTSDTNKETYLFDMPRVKFSSGAPTVPGKNQNVMLPLAFQALRDPTYGYQLHIGRYWYYE